MNGKKICEIAIPVAIVGLPATRPTFEEKESFECEKLRALK